MVFSIKTVNEITIGIGEFEPVFIIKTKTNALDELKRT